MGGLGNQMFQIAAATSLAIENNDEAVFDFNLCFTPLQGNPSLKYVDNIFKKIKNSKFIEVEYTHKEKNHSYENIPYKKNLLIHGYFQSEKYFQKNKEKIIDLFHIDDKDISFLYEKYKNIDLKNTVSIHIRRGDYLNSPDIHPVCKKEYYEKAMQSFPNKNFLFVSQDIEWVKNNFKGTNIFYSENNNEILDLTLQTICSDNIIANSTFSWWGAYLNRNQNKKVIAPLQWFGKNSFINKNDIVPSNWTEI